jgi:hypothetical protein
LGCEREGEGVGRVIEQLSSVTPQEQSYHTRDFLFTSVPDSSHGKFDGIGGNFEDRETVASCLESDDAARLRDGDRGSDIFLEEKGLEAKTVRVIRLDESGQLVSDTREIDVGTGAGPRLIAARSYKDSP